MASFMKPLSRYENDHDTDASLEKEKEKLTADFQKAVQEDPPSLKRQGFSAIPDVTWADVGGDTLRHELNLHIVNRIKYPEIYEEFGMKLETGFLLYGPPGCGKTLIAKAVANEAGANFIHIKGPELLNKKWGESEKAVRTLFSRARACTPCILFFDEVDALTRNRGEQGVESVEIPLNQSWTVERSGRVFNDDYDYTFQQIDVFGRPDLMDPAVLEPGRFGKHMYVPLPNKDERGFILKALARNKPIDSSVNLSEIGQRTACEKFTRADLAALMHEAAMAAVEEKLTSHASWGSPLCIIKETHFEQALAKITPSLSHEDLRDYENLRKQQGKWTSKGKARKGEHKNEESKRIDTSEIRKREKKKKETMKDSDSEISSMKPSNNNNAAKLTKPPFVPAKDDTKPGLQDPILRSDPIETEEAVLRLPPFPINRSKNPQPKMS
ncbi:cell division control protein 48 homolog C-like [Prunus yedoensis var. nudiflora]|uniref:Cell division control protein 48 homolog C-like n=1 Tax=Prunus yedoensis var. nudiflora TaxID=2094558 RepID=A0A314YSK1_PRUYE|nr:cell division control protein 48 homolog C-like [Prunus yedoensis var. nudiflora]